MDEQTINLVVFIAMVKEDPYFSFILNSTPAIVVCLLGGMVEVVTNNTEINVKYVLATMAACVMLGIVLSHFLRKINFGIGSSVVALLFAGFAARPLLSNLAKKAVVRIENILKGDF